MERTELFDLMGELKLYGMKAAFSPPLDKFAPRRSSPTPASGRDSCAPPGQEAAHRMRLPAGRLHDGRNGCALRALEQRKHFGLLRLTTTGLGRPLRTLISFLSKSDRTGRPSR